MVDRPIDNACYLGHVIAEDVNGLRARSFAEDAIKGLRLKYDMDQKAGV